MNLLNVKMADSETEREMCYVINITYSCVIYGTDFCLPEFSYTSLSLIYVVL